MTKLQRLYYWLGYQFGFLELEGVYRYDGQDSGGMCVMTRIGDKYITKDNHRELKKPKTFLGWDFGNERD